MAHFVRVGSDLETLGRLVLFGGFYCRWCSQLAPLCCRPDRLCDLQTSTFVQAHRPWGSGTNKIRRILGRSALCSLCFTWVSWLGGRLPGAGTGWGVSDGEGKVIKCVLTIHWCQDQETPLPSGMDPPSCICIFEIQNALKTEGIFFFSFSSY